MRSRALRIALAALSIAGSLASGCTHGGPATAREPVREEARAPLPPRQTRPLFWRVASSAGNSLHLLGSVHVGPPEGWRHPRQIETAFAASDTLVVELDTRHLDPEVQQMLLFEYAMLPSDTSLRERLSAETWALLLRQLEHSALELDAIDRLRPWMVANLLVVDAAGRRGLSAHMGVDHDFLARAGARHVLALETSRNQMALMAGLDDGLQEFSLRDTLGHSDDIGDYLEAMVDAWRLGEEKELARLLFEGLDENAEAAVFFERLIFERNRSMAAKLADWLADERSAGRSAFVVIGAAHLIGPRSVCALLAERGYRVERLRSESEARARDGGE